MELSKGRLVGNVQNKQLVSSEFILTSMKATLWQEVTKSNYHFKASLWLLCEKDQGERPETAEGLEAQGSHQGNSWDYCGITQESSRWH
jgi:hypothetical protein